MAGELVVDTSALMAILLEEPEAVGLAEALTTASSLRMSAPSWLETAMVATARRGSAGYKEFQALVERLGIEIVPCDEAQTKAAYAAWLRFGKGRHPASLNFGDCFSYSLAKLRGEPLLFKGEDFSKTDLTVTL